MTDWATTDLSHRRQQYVTEPLSVAAMDDDPVQQWWRWFRHADEAGAIEPHAMVVSTVDEEGYPDARVVLARNVDEAGIWFYTNYRSAKSVQLTANPATAATFAWLVVHRQVRVRGDVRRATEQQSDAYFASRPRESQLGAWASAQSSLIPSRRTLEDAMQFVTEEFAGGDVPRPPHWGGWVIQPTSWEFWQGRPNRLHDRVRYTPTTESTWQRERMAP